VYTRTHTLGATTELLTQDCGGSS